MRRIGTSSSEQLYSVEATRLEEQRLIARNGEFEPMAQAGLDVARLAQALEPHARQVWIACGPGNNGGDGLVAARHLLRQARNSGRSLDVRTTLLGDPGKLPAPAKRALQEALSDGVVLSDTPPQACDIAIDALLGLGISRAPDEAMASQLLHMHERSRLVLSVDLPSGLRADSGVYLGPVPRVMPSRRATLSMLTLKPGLFTADGRDMAGEVWYDALGAQLDPCSPTAHLYGGSPGATPLAHASHKGTRGDVVVVGGQAATASAPGMKGAAILAARAALHAGAGRVHVSLLGHESHENAWDPAAPELMFRHSDALLADRDLLDRASVVCGCGGGAAVAAILPQLLVRCPRLVLDADALNTISRDVSLLTLTRRRSARQWLTVVTPHPLEAARLLGTDTARIMDNRLSAARNLARHLDAICVLKGSGTVVAEPDRPPYINASGNPALATAGTGDVLAGWIGSELVQGPAGRSPREAVSHAVYQHGLTADRWIKTERRTLTAHRLIDAMMAGPCAS